MISTGSLVAGPLQLLGKLRGVIPSSNGGDGVPNGTHIAASGRTIGNRGESANREYPKKGAFGDGTECTNRATLLGLLPWVLGRVNPALGPGVGSYNKSAVDVLYRFGTS